MYEFRITSSRGEAVIARVPSGWDQLGVVSLKGAEIDCFFVRSHIQYNGMTPLGRIAQLPKMEPMSIYYTFSKSPDFDVEILEGQQKDYPVDEHNEPIWDFGD